MANDIVMIAIGAAILIGLAVLIYFNIKNGNSSAGGADSSKIQLDMTNLINERMNEIKDLQAKGQSDSMKFMMDNQEKNLKQMSELRDIQAKNQNDSMKFMMENQASNLKQMNEIKDIQAKNQTDSLKIMMENQEKSLKQMGEVQKQMAEMATVQKSLENISTDVVKLSDILSNNQSRGRFGEVQLEMLLGSIFGETNKGLLFDVQYNLDPGSGLRPDAVIFLDGDERKQVVCIDSKFSLAGAEDIFDSSKKLTDEELAVKTNELKSALKNRINETSKYVIKGKTIDSSLMFIPSDGIFVFIDSKMRDVIEYAYTKNVVITCPATLPPLLNSFKVFQKDVKKTKNVEKMLEQMRKFEGDFGRFGDRWAKVSNDITRLYNDSKDLNITTEKIVNRFDEINEGKTYVENIDVSQ